jgi:hypothetical protein
MGVSFAIGVGLFDQATPLAIPLPIVLNLLFLGAGRGSEIGVYYQKR